MWSKEQKVAWIFKKKENISTTVVIGNTVIKEKNHAQLVTIMKKLSA